MPAVVLRKFGICKEILGPSVRFHVVPAERGEGVVVAIREFSEEFLRPAWFGWRIGGLAFKFKYLYLVSARRDKYWQW